MKNGTGVDLKISKTQIRYLVQEGGSLWSSLINLGMRALPYASRAVSKAGPALATGALSALGSLGIDKIFGKGQTGGFLVPQSKIDQLIKYKDLLTKKQIVSALHTGGQIVIKPTKSQSGGFLGTLLASIGIPLILNALTGKGLQVDRHRSKRSTNVYVPPSSIGISAQPQPKSKSQNSSGGLVLPMNQLTGMYPPPFIGSWKKPVGMGLKKKKLKAKKGKGLLLGKNSPFNSIPLIGAIL